LGTGLFPSSFFDLPAADPGAGCDAVMHGAVWPQPVVPVQHGTNGRTAESDLSVGRLPLRREDDVGNWKILLVAYFPHLGARGTADGGESGDAARFAWKMKPAPRPWQGAHQDEISHPGSSKAVCEARRGQRHFHRDTILVFRKREMEVRKVMDTVSSGSRNCETGTVGGVCRVTVV
jgi:hypothetical protein